MCFLCCIIHRTFSMEPPGGGLCIRCFRGLYLASCVGVGGRLAESWRLQGGISHGVSSKRSLRAKDLICPKSAW